MAATNNRKFVNHIIRNVVQQNSIPDGTIPSSEAQFNLNKYFDDPNTVDIVYINMMERVRNEKSHYEPVLSRILKIIKNNIALHAPSLQILLELDSFCINISTTNNVLQKSITYIRALIANQVKIHPNYQIQTVNENNLSKRISVGLVRTRSQSAGNSMLSNSREDSLHTTQPRISLDLSNVLGVSASSISSSTSSPPQSLIGESPIRNTLLSSGGVTHNVLSPLSPTLTSSLTSTSPLNQDLQGSGVTLMVPSSNFGNGSTGMPSNLKDSNASVLSSNTLLSSNGFTSPTLTRRAMAEDGYLCDLMSVKTNLYNQHSNTNNGHKSTTSNTKIQSLLTHSPFGDLKSTESKSKDLYKCPDDSNNFESINVVQQAKKKIEQKDSTIFTFKRRKQNQILFQYKYYSEQVPLKIKESEKDQVVKVIINPATPQDRSIATKIFIKILLDIYCAHSKNVHEGESIIQNYFKQIMESPNRDNRVHLFNIIFNLSIHINVYSELKLEDGSQGEIGELQDSVFSLLKDVLTYCLANERDEKVWNEALNCLLFFIVEQGVIIKHRLLQLNVQIIASILAYTQDCISDQVKRMLIRMLCNFLYKDSCLGQNSYINLNEEVLNSIGGIDFIIGLYTSVRSNEAKNNLFVVIFDYVLQSALKSQTIVDTQLTQEAPLLLELFKRADAPHFFVQIFKCIPEKDFVSDFFLFTSTEDSKHEASHSYEDLIIKFTMKIHEHAVRYQKVDQQCEKYLMDVQDSVEKTSQLLLDWISNDNDEYLRFNAANCLFNLLKKVIVDKDNVNSSVTSFSYLLFVQLATHPNPKVRRIYISLTERLILTSKYRLKSGGTKSSEIFEMLNECISRITSFGEKDEVNLLMVLDIIFDLIYNRNGTKQLYIKENWLPDTNYSLFLTNQFVISTSLLKSINISILQYLFTNISPTERYNEPRLVLLHLLIHRCHDADDLAKIGGIGLFLTLLNDPCTSIAYHSSYFLLKQLEKTWQPMAYRSILTRLLSKARENNDENMISNPYFQVQGIISEFKSANLHE